MTLGDHSFWQRGTEVLLTTALEPYSKFITQGEMLFTYLYSQIFCSCIFRCLSRMNSKPFKQYYTLILLNVLLHSELNTWLPVVGTWNEFKMRSSDIHILAQPKLRAESINWKWDDDSYFSWPVKTDWVTTQKMLQYPERKTPSKWLWNLLDSEKAGLSMPKHEGTSKRLR